MASRPSAREWSRIRRLVFDRDGWRCCECGKAGRLECDHKTPLHLGGSNDPDNLQTLCRACHIAKTRLELEALRNGDPVPGVEAWDALIARMVSPE